MHCGPSEGRSCPVEVHGWQHKLALPTITTLPLNSPSLFMRPQTYFPLHYFSSRLTSLLSHFSNRLPPPPLSSSLFLIPAVHSPLHLPYPISLYSVCTSSVRGQLTLRRADTGRGELTVWRMLTNTLDVKALRTPSRHRCTQSPFLRHLKVG